MTIQVISRCLVLTVVLAVVLIAGVREGLTAAESTQGWNLNEQAADACERALTLQMGTDTKARDPQSTLDSRSLTFRQGGNDMVIRGGGNFSA